MTSTRLAVPVNRRIAVGLILALLAQSFLPGVALAWRAGPSPGQTLLICTGDGVKQIALDPGKRDDQPRAQQCCPCAIPCGACALPGVDRIGARTVYAVAAPLPMQLGPVTPTRSAPTGAAPFACAASELVHLARSPVLRERRQRLLEERLIMLRTLISCGLVAALLSPFGSQQAPALTILAQGERMDEQAGHAGMANSFTVGDLVVEAPWARESVTRTGAAYMTLRNNGDQPDRLVGTSSDVAETVQLHSSATRDGVMQMRAVETVEVPAQGEVMLEPGGLHVMLVGLKVPLEEGKSFPLTLEFERAGKVQIMTAIEDIGHAGGDGHEHGHGN